MKPTNMLKSFLYADKIEAGCDEAGRGCLAGPVFASAVILPPNFECELLNDSKQLSEKIRYQLRSLIEKEAIAWAVGIVSHTEIDQINILKASIKAMHKAISQLEAMPQHILVDGNKFNPYKDIPHTCVVKGDAQYASIAAASILAKTYRDDYMLELHKQYPQYGWAQNKGYPTVRHRQAIKQFGVSPFHRTTFRLLTE